MITFVFLAAAGAGMGISYIKIRDFVRDRLRFVDAAQRKSTPWLVGVAAGFAAAVLVPFLPVLGGGTAIVFGIVTGTAVRSGQKQVKLLNR
ncbi:MAG: hypothetical protein E2O48_02150 [Gemmatimonadetes bacterium]|nr:MAG: hypothetical protein E2O48_02150 [Gemmatimonadota bacterium]